jgi:RHS repeat-associated protein
MLRTTSLPGNCELELWKRIPHAIRSEIIGWQLFISYWLRSNLSKFAKRACIFVTAALIALPSLALVNEHGLPLAACFLCLVVCMGLAARLLQGLGSETWSRRLGTLARLNLLTIVFLGTTVWAVAQTLPPTTADDQMGLQPYQSYHGGDIDHIGLSNGTLSVDFPFLEYPQRGNLNLSFHLYYNNQPEHYAIECIPDPTPNNPNNQKCFFAWNFTPVASLLPVDKGDVFVGWAGQMAFYSTDSVVKVGGTTNAVNDHYSNWSIQMADGSKHVLGNMGSLTWINTSTDNYSVASGPLETLDATGWRVNGSLTTDDYGTTAPALTRIVSPGGVLGGTEDANGNVITITGTTTAGVATGFSDTLGRQIPAPPTAQSASNTDTTTCPVPPQVALPVAFAVMWIVPGPNGGSSNYKFCYASLTINRPPVNSSAPYQGTSNQNILQSIVLPDGHTWNFQYNDPGDGSTYGGVPVNYGTLTQITLPTGGTISYTYVTTSSGDGSVCQNFGRFVATRTLNANDGTGSHTWNYGYNTVNNGNNTLTVTTTVTDPLGNYVVHTFNSLYAGDFCPAYEGQTQYFQGGGTLQKTVNTAYSFNAGDNKNGPINVVPTQISTSWPNGKTATVIRGYDSGFSYTSFKGSTGLPGLYGKMLSESASDYGTNVAGPTLKTTSTSYLAFSNSSYLNANLLNLVSSTTIKAGGGCKLAETDTTYDEANYLTSYPSSLPTGTHVSPPNSVRGNPTTVTQQLFAAGACPTTTQAGPTSHTNWYDTGEVYQSTDPLGNTATHNYDPAYGGALPTKTINPLNQSVTGAYDFNTGLLTSFTDANGNSTSLAFDNMRRVTSITFPKDAAGNQPRTGFSYSAASAGFPVTVTRTKSVTTGLSDSVSTSLDGLGRPYQTQHATPNGNATVVTTYDADGRVSTVTNPYFATSDPTYGVSTTQYDGIGRVIKTIKQDNSTVTAQYNQSSSTSTNADCTIGTDEAGNQRQTCTDGIGRLIEVDEPGNPFTGTGATGSVTVNGTLGSASVPDPNNPPTSGQASFTVTSDGTTSNGDRVVNVTSCRRVGNNNVCTTVPSYDTGTITVTVNGFTSNPAVNYSNSSSVTTSSLASSLASALNASGSPVHASSNGSTVTMVANATGPSSNYSWSSQSVTTNSSFPVNSTSFPLSPSSGSLSGGSQPMITIYDSGTVNMTVGSFTASACYGPSGACTVYSGCPTGASTASQVACFLASSANPNGLNRAGSPVSASYSGSTLTLTYLTPGQGGDVAVSITSASNNTSQFPNGSFSGSGSLNNGQNPYPSGIAHPYLTLYSYDGLGNLLQVNQKGDGSQAARVRSFTYDSLARLTQAANPESGTIQYAYDSDNNLLQKTSPAPNQTSTATQTISYCYDPLNRITGKAYSAQNCTNGRLPSGTAIVSYTYDTGTNGIGHVTSLTDQAGSGSYGYDALGRITSEMRTIAGITKSMSYSYYLDNSINTFTYPSGAVITYTPWNNGTNAVAGAAQSAVDNSNAINYGMSANYQADGQLTGLTIGKSGTFNGITESLQYNPRRQICRITALTTGSLPSSCTDSTHAGNILDLGYNLSLGAGDNGNVLGITNYKDSSRSQTFTYDAMNRLTSAQNAGTNCSTTTANGKTEYWGNSYGYDPWGNLVAKTVTKCSAENLSVTVNTSNQFQGGYTYDAAGNMMHDATASLNYTYDAENRITGAAGYTYTYDDEGNRVEKSNGSSGTLYWYMSPGIVAESDLTGALKSEYVFFAGGRVARKDLSGASVEYYFSDQLKTASVITDAGGNIKAESDYYPWGGELQLTANDSNHYKFTGKERDGETGLDYFGARYYSNGMGRFVTPDWAAKAAAVPYADLKDPQSLNLYSYVRNRPMVLVDLDGHEDQAQPNGPPVVHDNGEDPTCGCSQHTYTVTQIVQTQSDPQPITLDNGQPGTQVTTTTTTYTATFNMDNQIVDGSASKQSVVSTQQYDSSKQAVGDARTVEGPKQNLGSNDIRHGLSERDLRAFTNMQDAASHWWNTSLGSIGGKLAPLVPGYAGKALGIVDSIVNTSIWEFYRGFSYSSGGLPPGMQD